MLFFGPISSLFDFAMFAILLWGFDAGPTLFRSGWFAESLATQSLAIFAIRTRRIPFTRSRPSAALLLSTLIVVGIGIALPFSPLAHLLGLGKLPVGLVVVIAVILPSYVLLLDLAKRGFYRLEAARPARQASQPARARRIARRAARWSVHTLVPDPVGRPRR
jgi:Mg2+-importing ATPase